MEEGRGRGETCSGTFVITKDSPFFCFFSLIWRFFFYKLDGSIVLGWQGSICEQSCRFVLIRIGDRRVFSSKCEKFYIAEGRKTAFGFVDGTDFLCCNIVITRISVL